MTLADAIRESEYVTACAEQGVYEIIVSAEGTDGSYTAEQWDSMGNNTTLISQRPLDEVERALPRLNWWPMREAGEWGSEEEERRRNA